MSNLQSLIEIASRRELLMRKFSGDLGLLPGLSEEVTGSNYDLVMEVLMGSMQDGLPTFSDEQVYGEALNGEIDLRDFVIETPQVFVLVTECGYTLLVDTQGYNYARYIACLG